MTTHRDRCAVCEGPVAPIIDLPHLPLTDSYCWEPLANPIMGVDQKLLYCQSCGHGQLETLIAPDVLYGANYFFRTSSSPTARKGTEFFLSLLNEIAPGRQFRCALDVGCNDLFLLQQLKDRAVHRAGIDPVWRGRECEDESIQVFGMNFEEVDLHQLPEKPDLIVCRHTLEHIVDPRKVVEALMEFAADDALFLFEVPGFDGLIQRQRFDQVFHQHAQYFSLSSFLKLLDIVGGHHLLHRFNFHDWGAMVVAFEKGDVDAGARGIQWSIDDISDRYTSFQQQMKASGELLAFYADTPLYGYGAAQMLPVLGYHMGTDFSELIAVIDDDEAKDGLGYWNLPAKVTPSRKVGSLAQATVLITAIDNVQPILAKLLANRPRHLILPLNVI